MNVRPRNSDGFVRKLGEKFVIELSAPFPDLEADAPVQVVFWDTRPVGARSDIEEIARVQQIELEVVAKGLSAEGALTAMREEFVSRVQAAV
jgi:hypothetical protein